MSLPSEHDYIGLSSELPSMEESSDGKTTASGGGLNMKATELRLGLPGSESPEREHDERPQLSIGLNNNNSSCFVSSGSKRGFSVAIHNGSGNWGFSGSAGSDAGKVVNGSDSCKTEKDGSPQSPKPAVQEKKTTQVDGAANGGHAVAPASKAQVVGWPPIRSFRKNTMASQPSKNDDDGAALKSVSGCLYIKVSMDGAPYLRKVDLKTYGSYVELSSALEKMFSCFTIGQCGSHGVPAREGLSENPSVDPLHGSEYVLTYEDKDGDWMLVGDVPWKMFANSCRRMRIMKSSEAIGLAPRATEKGKYHN